MSVFANRNFDELEDVAKTLGQRWGITEVLKLVNDSENIVYYLEGNDELVIRLTENRHKRQAQLKSEVSFINHIQKRVQAITTPVLSLNNTHIETLHMQGKLFHVSVFKKAPGASIEGGVLITADLAKDIGALAGNIHYFSKQYRPQFDRYDFINSDHLQNTELYTQRADLLKERDKVVNWYNSLPRCQNSFGLIHGDIHFGNFFHCQAKGITLFDFDDCSNSFFIHELGLHLWYAKQMHLSYKNELHFENYQKNLLRSYKSKIDLDPRWYDLIEDFSRFRTIEMCLWSLKMFDYHNLNLSQARYLKNMEQKVLEMQDQEYTLF